jgi:hypothetical protein
MRQNLYGFLQTKTYQYLNFWVPFCSGIMVTAVDSLPLPRLTKCGLSACTFTVFAGSDNGWRTGAHREDC